MRTDRIENIKAVLLVGDRDFGRCPLAARLNRCLWPIGDKPVLQRLIEQIAAGGLCRFVISCRRDDGSQIRSSIRLPANLDVQFRDETMPCGSAGSIRDAFETGDELILVFSGVMTAVPDIKAIIEEHKRGHSPMTVWFNPCENGRPAGRTSAQIYVCEPAIMGFISPVGYCDVKEGLIPRLVQAGVPITAATLPAAAGDFRRWHQYLAGMYSLVSKMTSGNIVPEGYKKLPGRKDVLVAGDVHIDGSARLIGPLLLSGGVRIGPEALVFGPSIIGPDVEIADRAMVCQSVLWRRACIGAGSRVENCLVDAERIVADNTDHRCRLLIWDGGVLADMSRRRHSRLDGLKAEPASEKVWPRLSCLLESRRKQLSAAAFAVLLFAGLLWAYWTPTLEGLWGKWMGSDEYSSGILAPFLAVYILWTRRKRLLDCVVRPRFAGVVVLVVGQSVRLFGLVFMYGSLENLSLLISLAGLVILIFGWGLFGQVWSALGYLLFMFPLPQSVQKTISLPLQDWATASAVFCLETFGFQVIRRGNILEMNGVLVGVAEACNGLRMLTAFFVVSGFVVLMIERPRWQKLLVLVSSVPIAIVCNTLRLAVTAAVFTQLDGQKWLRVFHDYGGLAMMPLALFMVAAELYLMAKVVVVPADKTTDNIITGKGRSGQ